MSNQNLKDKIAIVTGAGSGIGAGISKILHDRGATLALCDLFGEKNNFVYIIDSPIFARVRIYFGLTGCPKKCPKKVSFLAKYQILQMKNLKVEFY